MADNFGQYLIGELLRSTALTLELLFTPPRFIGEPLPQRVTGADPVIVVHGIVDSQNGSYDVANTLRRDGFTVFTPTMPANGLDGVMENVEYLRRYVAWVLQVTGARKVDFVGHSQGGLSIRAFIRAGGAGLVDSAVTINSPHHGVSGFWRGVIDVVKAIPLLRRAAPVGLMELDSRSPVFNWLNDDDETPGDVRYTTIWSRDSDGIVFPWTSPILSGARNVTLYAGRSYKRGPHHLFANHTNLEAFSAVRAALLEPRPQAALGAQALPPATPSRRRRAARPAARG